MIKNLVKIKAFTLTEAIVTLAIIGLIASIVIPQLIYGNPSKRGQETMALKMAENLTQASTQMIIYNASTDDFTGLKFQDEYFSIEDKDVTPKMSKIYRNYLSDIDLKVNLKNEYFSKELVDKDKKNTGIVLKDTYSSFFHVNDGMLLGFRFYGNCTTTETNAFPPTFQQRYSVANSCGSAFYDINSFNKPNILGIDQFILPIGKRGIKYEDR